MHKGNPIQSNELKNSHEIIHNYTSHNTEIKILILLSTGRGNQIDSIVTKNGKLIILDFLKHID